jgi:hypothetical protein
MIELFATHRVFPAGTQHRETLSRDRLERKCRRGPGPHNATQLMLAKTVKEGHAAGAEDGERCRVVVGPSRFYLRNHFPLSQCSQAVHYKAPLHAHVPVFVRVGTGLFFFSWSEVP